MQQVLRIRPTAPAGGPARRRMRRLLATILTAVTTVGLTIAVSPTPASAACSGNAVACENQLAGTPASTWDIEGAGDDTIQGFSTKTSVNLGETINFKIKTPATGYRIEIYRLGYYQGNGARKIADVNPSVTLPQNQPACASDLSTEIYDCGTWGVSASWSVPTTVVSGVYIARLIRTDGGGDGDSPGQGSQIPFIVRDDSSHSAVVYQTSDPTWQAYNTYGQSDFYQGLGNGRAYKVSYNRPYATRGLLEGRDYLFSNEYPMLRFMEQNGYDMSYISGLDTDIRGNLLTNHKVFVSVGHDEYWSEGQRSSVEDARDAGVNLAFFSGNEVYWKTRWESSQDGNNEANRTLVCYKNTWANADIDPVDNTSTWRDPRFGLNGTGPENNLTGTMYMANDVDLAIKVSATEGKTRLWRNTAAATLGTGGSLTLAPHTIGYESDEDVDNGFRPAGLIDLSTTVGPTSQYLTDYGNTVIPGDTTHHVTMYKAPSGARVFSAGTIQWAWGVDVNHDGTVSPVDVRMQQATINILADMDARATTVISGLVATTKTTDATAPVAVITAPADGSTIAQGNQVTVTGTASDSGGVVAGVEVSVDGGATWHPATGLTSWTYTGILTGSGSQAIRVRAADDSGNIQSPTANRNITSPCPCNIFGNVVPKLPAANDSGAVSLGTRFTTATNGFVTGIRFYKGAGNTGTHTGTLFAADGTQLSTATFAAESATGWQTVSFPTAVAISTGTTYTAAYTAPNGHYAADSEYFAYRGVTSGALTAIGSYNNPNGVYGDVARTPQSSYKQTNYYVDPIFSTTDTTPLTAASASPIGGSSSVSVNTVVSAVFSRAVTPATVAITVTGPGSTAVTGDVTYDAASNKATFTPSQALDPGTTYSVSLQGSSPVVGPMAAPLTWTFTTAAAGQAPGVCPCRLFDETDAPAAGPIVDSPVELGVAFAANAAGVISGIRFYKDSTNAGPHTVSLWTRTGTLLGTATLNNESTAGWQQADFASPIAISGQTTYIASYRTSTGRYSYTSGGLGTPLSVGPLSTPASAGRYGYGANPPTSTSGTNYFVDPVFSPSAEQPPVVSVVDPTDNDGSVPVTSTISATFDALVQTATVSFAVKDPNGVSVAGTVSGDPVSNTATFTPSAPLADGVRYTVTVSGAKSPGGVVMTNPFASSFTTTGVELCPCTVLTTNATPAVSDSGDAGPITVGLRFRPTVSGYLTGLRVYLDAANTGTHTGTLYDLDGLALATLTFPAATQPGWQTASFSTPFAVTAGTTYVAASFAPVGHYSATSGFYSTQYFNGPLTGLAGLYRYGSDAFPTNSSAANYYVDVVFATTTGGAPSVSSRTPAAGASSVPTDSAITAGFDGPVDPASLVFTLTAPGQTPVAGVAAVDSATNRATFTPNSPLAFGTNYTASVVAVGSGGGVMPAPVTWSFTTATAPVPTVSAQTPAAGATGIAAATAISATFTVPVDPATVVFGVTGPGGGAVTGTTTYNAATSVATFQPIAVLGLNSSYTASLSATGTAGGAMTAPAIWSFTTVAPEVPSVSGQTPASGATGVAQNTSVAGTFSVPVTSGTVTFTLSGPGAAAVAGAMNYNATTRVATFQPAAALAYNTTYTASLRGTGATGGAMTAPVTWTFTTVAAPAPTVSGQAPASAATAVAITSNVTGTFSIPITTTTLAFTLTPAGGTAVPAAVSYNTTTRVATLDPTAALVNGTTYTASLSATSSIGGVMAAPVTWTFTTVVIPAPTVSGQSPAAGATSVALSSAVTGTFNIAINTATLVFTLTPAGGTAVAGTVSYSTTTRVARFQPTAALAYGTVYTASLRANSSVGGVMAAPVTWTFTTVSAPAPTVSGQSPANGATGVAAATTVAGTFNIAVTPTTVVLTVTAAGGAAVAGTTSYNTNTRVATFQPSAKLAYGTVYTASLRGTSTVGGVMAAPATWSFTTVPAFTLNSIFAATEAPTGSTTTTSGVTTFGVGFYPTQNGTVTAIELYTGTSSAGTQQVTLYLASNNSVLGTGTSVASTTAGWRTVTLATPVAVTANQNYVAAFTVPTGTRYYSTTFGLLGARSTGVVRTRAGAGFMRAGTGFPTTSGLNIYNNYWVDVVVSVPSA